MRLIEGAVRRYDWGSRTAIPDLVGAPATGEPWAELWLGAHPVAPAVAGPEAEPLDRLIAADPVAALGRGVAARFGRLPFLAKVLAAAAPLSLQAHPSTVQARAGFDREEASGVPLDAPERMFRDRSHKPEMVCALSRFEAFSGFRDPARTAALLETVDTAALDAVRRRLGRGSPEARRGLMRWLLTLDPSDAARLVEQVAQGCLAAADDEWSGTRAAVADLAARHRRDGAVVVALLLNHVVLEPGEALFVAAGNLHAYLGGMALEVMAESDNVVRGGLTAKHVDVGALLDVMDSSAGEAQTQRPEVVDGVAEYSAPADEFSLRRIEVDGAASAGSGPAVLLCTEGCAEAGPVVLDRGAAAWIAAADPPPELRGRATVYRVGVGDYTASGPTRPGCGASQGSERASR